MNPSFPVKTPLQIRASKSSSITLAAAFTIFLAVSVATLLYFMHLASSANKRNEIASIVETDMQGLLDTHRAAGLDGLVDILHYRLKHPDIGRIYALANARGTVLVGNFAYIPTLDAPEKEVFPIILNKGEKKESGLPANRDYAILASYVHLPDGYVLMVGRNIADMKLKQQWLDVLGWGVIIMLTLLAAAGFFIGDRVVYRINLIAQTAAYIMRTGDLSKRIPIPNSWDDLSRLAEILNALIDRVELLMNEVRQVSDDIAHDLRTPLTRIKNQLEMLHDRGEDEQLGISEETEKLIEEADRLLATFAALLRIGNIESGKWRNEGEPLEFDALVADVVEFYEPLALEKDQVLDVTLEPVSLIGDKHLLFQAVANILDNAIKYAPCNALISVSLRANKITRQVVLEIMNEGSRVDEGSIEKIFQRFYRTDNARCSKSGNGLGLSLVRAIVELHHGDIRAENRKNGFCISIQLLENAKMT